MSIKINTCFVQESNNVWTVLDGTRSMVGRIIKTASDKYVVLLGQAPNGYLGQADNLSMAQWAAIGWLAQRDYDASLRAEDV